LNLEERNTTKSSECTTVPLVPDTPLGMQAIGTSLGIGKTANTPRLLPPCATNLIDFDVVVNFRNRLHLGLRGEVSLDHLRWGIVATCERES
jgi:hypothetical protein